MTTLAEAEMNKNDRPLRLVTLDEMETAMRQAGWREEVIDLLLARPRLREPFPCGREMLKLKESEL